MSNQVFIGVDIGGTKIGVNGVDQSRKPLSPHWIEVPSNSHIGPQATVQQIVVGLRTFLEKVGLSIQQVTGLGVDSPGPADINGKIERSANMHPAWEGFHLRDQTQQAITAAVGHTVPVCYENDCNAAALWESFVGNPEGNEVMFLLAPGTGLGGGIVINGHLLRGYRGMGGELGHVDIVHPPFVEGWTPSCGCGGTTCAEAYASMAALMKILPVALTRPEYANHPLNQVAGGPGDDVWCKRAFGVRGLAAKGDSLCQGIFDWQSVENKGELKVKLSILADAAKYDASCASSGSRRRNDGTGLGNTTGVGICHSYTPDGRCVSLLKILLTNYCIYDCKFCVNRVTSDTPRARFTPAEVVRLTVEFYKRNYIEGLFLSSGIIQSADYTMEQLIEVAHALRTEHRFMGYIHLKAVPGASDELLAAAGRWADRLSANIELPTQEDLTRLAPEKTHAVIENAMTSIATKVAESKEERAKSTKAPNFAPAGQSTQMVVGATPTPDREILSTATSLYVRHKLRRVYYSAFSPIPHGDSRLPVAAPPLLREHRLYQADWLMRFYGFAATELTTADRPNLEAECDPKMGWALRNPSEFPVDLNKAPRGKLLRVPGLGVRNVERILQIRRWRSLRLADLAKLRLSLGKVRPFVIVADHNPDALRIDRLDLRTRVVKRDEQLELFDSARSATTGEV